MFGNVFISVEIAIDCAPNPRHNATEVTGHGKRRPPSTLLIKLYLLNCRLIVRLYNYKTTRSAGNSSEKWIRVTIYYYV